MSTYTANGIFQNQNSSTTFRAWAQLIHDGLAACGLVQTSDTGQINLTTVTVPGTTTTYAGYEIWRFNDALQATRPVYIKVEYGSGTTAGNTSGSAGMRISVSNSTNGAGTLNGTVVSGAKVLPGGGGAQEFQVAPFYFCGDTSSIVFAVPQVNSSGFPRPGVVMVERTRNSDGTPSGDGLCFVVQQSHGWGSASSSYGDASTDVMSFLAPGVQTYRVLPCTSPSAYGWWDQAGAIGNDLMFYPFLIATPRPQPPQLALIGCYSYAGPPLVTLSTVINGASHTYLMLGSQTYGAVIPGPTSSWATNANYSTNYGICSLLMRYE